MLILKITKRQTFDKNKFEQLIGLKNDQLCGKIMTKIVALRSKRYSYLINGIQNEKRTKKVCNKIKT